MRSWFGPIDGDYLDDLDSRNGTFVNRRRIAAHLLEHGDEIQIGRITLRYLDALTQALLQANDV